VRSQHTHFPSYMQLYIVNKSTGKFWH